MNDIVTKTTSIKHSDYVDTAALVAVITGAFAVVVNTF